MESAARSFIQNAWSPTEGEPIVFDRTKFFEDNRDEILETFEVVDTLKLKNKGAALVRFSVGSDIYRSAIWVRKIDNSWLPSNNQGFSEYSTEYELMNDRMQSKADAIIKKVDKWEEESQDAWWMW
jgi:hypothetical protein